MEMNFHQDMVWNIVHYRMPSARKGRTYGVVTGEDKLMLDDLIYKMNQDRFKNYKFSGKDWSAPCHEKPEMIRAQIDSFHLVGRRIKKLRFIGLNYLLVRDRIEDSVYGSLAGISEEERQMRSDYMNISPGTLFARRAQIDEPILIMFEDEDVLEIDTPQESAFRMSMNRIPWWIDSGCNLPNVHADALLSPCLGKLITDVEVHTYKTNVHPMYRCTFETAPFEREYVKYIVLRFEDGSGLSIGGWVDFTMVQSIDCNNNGMFMSWEELNPGLFNWEDLHNDPVSGYEAESPTVFFGRKGADHAETPFMSIFSDRSNSVLHIPVNDFDLLGWSFTKSTESVFDEYGEYHFTFDQWYSILKEAEYLLNLPTFDDLFDYVVSWNIRNSVGHNCMILMMNSNGTVYWKERERYRIQLTDLMNWTRHVATSGDSINILGF